MFGHSAIRHGGVGHGMLYSPILHPYFLPPYQSSVGPHPGVAAGYAPASFANGTSSKMDQKVGKVDGALMKH